MLITSTLACNKENGRSTNRPDSALKALGEAGYVLKKVSYSTEWSTQTKDIEFQIDQYFWCTSISSYNVGTWFRYDYYEDKFFGIPAYTVKFNGRGFITEVVYETKSESKEQKSVKIFQYGPDDKLVSMKKEYWQKGFYEDDNTPYESIEKTVTNLTWEDGNITKIEQTIESEDDEIGTCTMKTAWNFTYSVSENLYRAYCSSIAEAIDSDLAFAGLLGYGTNILPEGCDKTTEVVINGREPDRSSSKRTITIEDTTYGSIKCETINSALSGNLISKVNYFYERR